MKKYFCIPFNYLGQQNIKLLLSNAIKALEFEKN